MSKQAPVRPVAEPNMPTLIGAAPDYKALGLKPADAQEPAAPSNPELGRTNPAPVLLPPVIDQGRTLEMQSAATVGLADVRPIQQPGQHPGPHPGQYPGQYPGPQPGQYPGPQPGPQPGQYAGPQPGQYPGQHPIQQTIVQTTPLIPFETTAPQQPAPQQPAGRPGIRDTLPTQREITVLPLVELQGERFELVRQSASRYEKLRDLGSGAMGEVALARDNDIGRTVAVKRLNTRANADQAGLLRFIAEVRTVGQLEHPNIVPIHDVGLDEHGNYYFVMKYIDGETLEKVIDKLAEGDPLYHSRYPVEVRLEIFLGLLRALQYAHDQGIIHRDLKPANVMIGPYGEVVLMDWGIAKQIRGVMKAPEPPTGPVKPDAQVRLFQTRNDQLIGTPAYMSPEQAMGRNDLIDERSDVYSATVMLHEMLSLRHYLADHETLESLLLAIASEPFPYMKLIFVRHPRHPVPRSELLHFVARGLAKNPEERFQSVLEMIAELQRLIDGRCGVRCPATLAKRSLREVASFVDRFPKFSPFVFYPTVLFLFFCILSTLYRLIS